MDGITSEGAVKAVENRYDLILIASRRVRELHNGYSPKVQTRGGTLVTALAEIEAGHIGREYLLKPTEISKRSKTRGHA